MQRDVSRKKTSFPPYFFPLYSLSERLEQANAAVNRIGKPALTPATLFLIGLICFFFSALDKHSPSQTVSDSIMSIHARVFGFAGEPVVMPRKVGCFSVKFQSVSLPRRLF